MMKRRTYTLWHKHLRLNNMVNNSSTIFSFHHPNSTIQQLNNNLTMNTFDNKHIQIIDFLASHHYQPTAKKGANWWYLSPLHDEKTASFKVDINKNVWYDFGLGKGGGVKTLIELLFHPNNFQDYLRNLTIANPVQQIQETKTADGIAFTNIETEELNHYALYKYVVQRGITWNVAKWYDSHNAYEVRDIDRVFPDFDLRFPWQAQVRMYDAPQMSGNEQTFGQDFFDELYQVADDVSDIGKGAIQVGLTSLGAILFPPYQPAISAGGGSSSSKLGWGDDDKYKKKYSSRSRSFGRGRR